MKEESQKDHILIIEDSVATAILLKNYLNNMGYQEISFVGLSDRVLRAS